MMFCFLLCYDKKYTKANIQKSNHYKYSFFHHYVIDIKTLSSGKHYFFSLMEWLLFFGGLSGIISFQWKKEVALLNFD